MRSPIHGSLISSAAILAVALLTNSPVRADLPERDAGLGVPPPGASLAGQCTIVYYNFCSGWIWILGYPGGDGWEDGDRVGVVYDLTTDCGGEECAFLDGLWYWRFAGGHYDAMQYHLYTLDGDGMLVEPPLASSALAAPMERWNAIPDLGPFSVPSPVALVAEKIDSYTPRFPCTDNNVRNASLPQCASTGVGAGTSFWFGSESSPEATVIEDDLGPTDLIVEAVFDCSGPTAIENATWSEIKRLFQ